QGMFVALATECMKLAADRGVEALYGFPNANSYPGFVRRLDWDHTGDIPLWIRPILPSRHKRVPRAIGPLADLAGRLLPRSSGRGFEICSGSEQPSALEEFLAPWRAIGGLCRVERTIERYRWRFSQAAEMSYRWIQVCR